MGKKFDVMDCSSHWSMAKQNWIYLWLDFYKACTWIFVPMAFVSNCT